VLETVLAAAMVEPVGAAGTHANGTRVKTVLTEIGPVEIDVSRDTDSSG